MTLHNGHTGQVNVHIRRKALQSVLHQHLNHHLHLNDVQTSLTALYPPKRTTYVNQGSYYHILELLKFYARRHWSFQGAKRGAVFTQLVFGAFRFWSAAVRSKPAWCRAEPLLIALTHISRTQSAADLPLANPQKHHFLLWTQHYHGATI